ncbi:hypothetical protein C9374_012844 [Naegleria lovaniensis]|uniref:Uncharacterized protein n=1 Tax=Naegleria lovaniensis TaxID=51637 RepID=A0AA88G7J1_NAELO|nr:uncharacterized protein C9374_012844 [Naegleria lovaniensis]KAG2373112.1 hypothetical protein C9374_012844 [Naegleria lovaniensis]
MSSSNKKNDPSSGYTPLHREGCLAFVDLFLNFLTDLEKEGRFQHRDLLISKFLSRLNVVETRNLMDAYGMVNPAIGTLILNHKRKFEAEQPSLATQREDAEQLRKFIASQPVKTAQQPVRKGADQEEEISDDEVLEIVDEGIDSPQTAKKRKQ